MDNFIQDGKVLQFTAPGGGVVAGTPYKINGLRVVAVVDAAEGEIFNGVVRGVVLGPKATGQTWSEGSLIYWDNGAGKFTTTSGGNTLSGAATREAATGDTTGYVYLDGVAR